MATVLSNEEEILYNSLKGVYNKVTNVGMVYSTDALHIALNHYNSYRGWIGRNSYWILPLIVLVSYEIGKRFVH